MTSRDRSDRQVADAVSWLIANGLLSQEKHARAIAMAQHSSERMDQLLVKLGLVNEQHLAKMARDVDLGSFLALGKGEDSSQGRSKSSILSCAYEAVIGAIFEDGGYPAVADFVARFFLPDIEGKKEELLIADAKSRLQEVLQEKHNEAPTYKIEAEEGPSHQKLFTVAVCFKEQILGTGQAGSKKEAEQKAAAAALAKIIPENG